MKKEKYMSWESYFMSIAVLSSFRSKDIKTQNGACIVNSEKKVIGVGYNGLPRGFDDNNERFWCDKDDLDIKNSKHSYVVHAEVNAIYNRSLSNCKNQVLYCTQFPCRECTKAIIQNRITKVVYLNCKKSHKNDNEVVEIMFNEAGVELVKFDDLNLKDSDFISNLNKLGEKFY